MPEQSRVLHAGEAAGELLVLEAPLSFWGGIDPATGRVIDRRHPQSGASVTDRILALPAGRGSSSSSTVLAEAIRAGTAPAAILLGDVDEIIVLGALVAEVLYGRAVPVLALDAGTFATLRTGAHLRVLRDGTLLRME